LTFITICVIIITVGDFLLSSSIERTAQMKKYVRNMDALGRVAIPKEIIKVNHFDENTLFAVKAVAEGILLIPSDDCCQICGGPENSIQCEFICVDCAEKTKNATN